MRLSAGWTHDSGRERGREESVRRGSRPARRASARAQRGAQSRGKSRESLRRCPNAEYTEFVYKVDGYYAPQSDAGLRFDDPDLAITWPVEPRIATVSDKDAKLPLFRDFTSPFD